MFVKTMSWLIHFFSLLYGIVFSVHHKLWKYDLKDIDAIDSSVPVVDIFVMSDTGYVPLVATHIKKKYELYELYFNDGSKLIAADEHLIYSKFGYSKFVKDLRVDEPVMSINGVVKCTKIEKLDVEEYTFDLTIASTSKLYYTNGILSHNSITSGIFISWYLLTNTDRNVMCVSENGDKVEELMDKIDVIMRNLPFYMKLGMKTDNIYTKVYDNGCKLKGQKTTENTGASFTIHVLYADEFALVNPKFLNKFYRTVYPTLSSSEISRMIITSTPRGLNKFYEIYEGAVNSSNLFNPIRTDWYEVPLQDKDGNAIYNEDGTIKYRGEEWKQIQIQQLGSEEDFNQEFGNQFVAGSTLLYPSASLRKMKHIEKEFVFRELRYFEDIEMPYNHLTWHPQFDISNIYNESCRFVFSIDLGSGAGLDYSVLSISQLLPMGRKEIEDCVYYSNEYDFFKLVQVGIMASNILDIPTFAKYTEILSTKIFIHENVKCVLELNHDGNYFKQSLRSDNSEVDMNHFIVKFKKISSAPENGKKGSRTAGIMMNDPLKRDACKKSRDLVKYNKLIMTEKTTIYEASQYSRLDNGGFAGMSKNDDRFCTQRNLSLYPKTLAYRQQIEELMAFLPKDFFKMVSTKLGKVVDNNGHENNNYLNILMD